MGDNRIFGADGYNQYGYDREGYARDHWIDVRTLASKRSQSSVITIAPICGLTPGETGVFLTFLDFYSEV